MRDYDFKLTEPSESSRSSEKGCRCSVAVGFLLVLLAIAIAVGVGIIVHFAGKPADVTCNYNLEGLAVSETNILQCAGLAAGNNRNICKYSYGLSLHRKLINTGHYRPTSETPFKWRFTS